MSKNKKSFKVVLCLLLLLFSSSLFGAKDFCKDPNTKYEELISHLAKLRDSQEFLTAEVCLEGILAQKKHRKNTEFISMYLRFLVWQNKTGKAEKKLYLFEKNSYDYHLLLADIKWINGDLKSAYKNYHRALKLKGVDAFSAIYLRKYILAKLELFGIDETRNAYKFALKKYPNSKEVESLKGIFEKKQETRERTSLVLETSSYDLDNNVSINEYFLNAQYSSEEILLGADFNFIKRSYPTVKLDDHIYGFMVGKNFAKHLVMGKLAYTYKADFSYKRLLSLEYSYKLTRNLIPGFIYQNRKYTSSTANLLNIFLDIYYRDLYARASFNRKFDSYLFKVKHPLYRDKVSGALWYSFGEVDSSSTFKTQDDFTVMGGSLYFRILKNSEIVGTYEKRDEEGFNYSMYKVGINYLFE